VQPSYILILGQALAVGKIGGGDAFPALELNLEKFEGAGAAAYYQRLHG
jgi:hypothetical protein